MPRKKWDSKGMVMEISKRKIRAAAQAMSRVWILWVVHTVYPSMYFITVLWIGFKSDLEREDAKILIADVSICLYVVLLLAALVYYMIIYAPKARYADAMSLLHAAAHAARDANWYLDQCILGEDEYSRAELGKKLGPCVEAVAQAFTIVTGTRNRSYIKLLCGDEGQEALNYIQTFVRDSITTTDRQVQERDKDESNNHNVYKNTAYAAILEDGDRYFFSNDIRKMPKGYRSSSQKQHGQLPYKSRILLPIRYVRTASEMTQGQSDSQLKSGPRRGKVVTAGFLGVDTNSPGVYDEACDVELGLMVADVLFPVLKRSWIAEELMQRGKTEAPTAAHFLNT